MVIFAAGFTQALPFHGAVAGHTGLIVMLNGADVTDPPGSCAVIVQVVLPCKLLSVEALLLFPDGGLSDSPSTTLAARPLQLILISVAPGAFHERVRFVPALIFDGAKEALIDGVGGT
jgi:hypothetical protein